MRWSEWAEIDSDCCQHIRNCGTKYEMIQAVWLDTTQEDKEKGLHQYVIVHGGVDLTELTDEDKEMAVSPYGYTVAGLVAEYGEDCANSMIAECFLEEDICCDACSIADADSFEEAEAFVKRLVAEHSESAI